MAASFTYPIRLGVRMVVQVMACLLLSCSVDDYRDECCEDNFMQYRFMYMGSNSFAQRIDHMQYHLFTADGRYLHQMYAYEGDWSRVALTDLLPGAYVLVGIGNLTDYGELSDAAAGGLEQFCLHITHYADRASGLFANGDPLYYGIREFTIEPGESHTYITDMAHIHCCLHLRIEWEGVPAFPDGYSFRLSGIGGGVDMHCANASYIGSLPFPGIHHYEGRMEEAVRLQSLSLQRRLYTLRYADSHIPVFTLYHDGRPITKDISLADVFRAWGWNPSSTPVQEYQVCMLIKLNGDIEIKQGFGANVSDWEDGGVIGG